jgi:hypothetical protein
MKNYLNKPMETMYQMDKQIANLIKQNEGMETAFKNKGIKFTKLSVDDTDISDERHLELLKIQNEYLKDISKKNRPPTQEKPKEKPKEQPKQKETKPNEVDDDDEEDEEEFVKEVKPVYSTITNMENIKRACFSKDYTTSTDLIKQQPLKFYKANYKFSGDNTGRPSYVAKNLLRGFVQVLDEYRKYFMICFRCILVDKETNEYRYPSYWIVNTNDDLKTVLGSVYNDFEFVAVEGEEAVCKLLKRMEKNEDENDEALIGEVYLH